MKGKAKRKLISQKMMLSLVDIVDKVGSKERKQAYWNTFHCQNKVYTANGKLYGKYCKNRFCTLCCANRKADIINRYLPVIEKWENPCFITLTVKSVPFNRLHSVMKSIQEEFVKIIEMYRKRNQRGEGIRLVGIRSLECNFNPVARTYNPHLHILTENSEMGYRILGEWFRRRKSVFWIDFKGQDIRPVKNSVKALMEIIKYGSKIFTEPDLAKKGKSKGNEKLYLKALNNIFAAMKGFRIFDRFGFNLPKETTYKSSKAVVVKEYYEWMYDIKYSDWLNTENELVLTAYDPPAELIELLENRIDNNSE